MNATNAIKETMAQLRTLTPNQRNAFLAAFLGWTLDAFDFFLMVFVLDDIARSFHVTHEKIAYALTLTLAFRPLGALLFGIAGDRFGRRIPLMVDVIFYSLMELLTGFAPTLTAFFRPARPVSAWRWAGNGDWERRSRWRRFRRRCVVCFPAFCRRAMPAATCLPPSCTR